MVQHFYGKDGTYTQLNKKSSCDEHDNIIDRIECEIQKENLYG